MSRGTMTTKPATFAPDRNCVMLDLYFGVHGNPRTICDLFVQTGILDNEHPVLAEDAKRRNPFQEKDRKKTSKKKQGPNKAGQAAKKKVPVKPNKEKSKKTDKPLRKKDSKEPTKKEKKVSKRTNTRKHVKKDSNRPNAKKKDPKKNNAKEKDGPNKADQPAKKKDPVKPNKKDDKPLKEHTEAIRDLVEKATKIIARQGTDEFFSRRYKGFTMGDKNRIVVWIKCFSLRTYATKHVLAREILDDYFHSIKTNEEMKDYLMHKNMIKLADGTKNKYISCISGIQLGNIEDIRNAVRVDVLEAIGCVGFDHHKKREELEDDQEFFLRMLLWGATSPFHLPKTTTRNAESLPLSLNCCHVSDADFDGLALPLLSREQAALLKELEIAAAAEQTEIKHFCYAVAEGEHPYRLLLGMFLHRERSRLHIFDIVTEHYSVLKITHNSKLDRIREALAKEGFGVGLNKEGFTRDKYLRLFSWVATHGTDLDLQAMREAGEQNPLKSILVNPEKSNNSFYLDDETALKLLMDHGFIKPGGCSVVSKEQVYSTYPTNKELGTIHQIRLAIRQVGIYKTFGCNDSDRTFHEHHLQDFKRLVAWGATAPFHLPRRALAARTQVSLPNSKLPVFVQNLFSKRTSPLLITEEFRSQDPPAPVNNDLEDYVKKEEQVDASHEGVEEQEAKEMKDAAAVDENQDKKIPAIDHEPLRETKRPRLINVAAAAVAYPTRDQEEVNDKKLTPVTCGVKPAEKTSRTKTASLPITVTDNTAKIKSNGMGKAEEMLTVGHTNKEPIGQTNHSTLDNASAATELKPDVEITTTSADTARGYDELVRRFIEHVQAGKRIPDSRYAVAVRTFETIFGKKVVHDPETGARMLEVYHGEPPCGLGDVVVLLLFGLRPREREEEFFNSYADSVFLHQVFRVLMTQVSMITPCAFIDDEEIVRLIRLRVVPMVTGGSNRATSFYNGLIATLDQKGLHRFACLLRTGCFDGLARELFQDNYPNLLAWAMRRFYYLPLMRLESEVSRCHLDFSPCDPHGDKITVFLTEDVLASMDTNKCMYFDQHAKLNYQHDLASAGETSLPVARVLRPEPENRDAISISSATVTAKKRIEGKRASVTDYDTFASKLVMAYQPGTHNSNCYPYPEVIQLLESIFGKEFQVDPSELFSYNYLNIVAATTILGCVRNERKFVEAQKRERFLSWILTFLIRDLAPELGEGGADKVKFMNEVDVERTLRSLLTERVGGEARLLYKCLVATPDGDGLNRDNFDRFAGLLRTGLFEAVARKYFGSSYVDLLVWALRRNLYLPLLVCEEENFLLFPRRLPRDSAFLNHDQCRDKAFTVSLTEDVRVLMDADKRQFLDDLVNAKKMCAHNLIPESGPHPMRGASASANPLAKSSEASAEAPVRGGRTGMTSAKVGIGADPTEMDNPPTASASGNATAIEEWTKQALIVSAEKAEDAPTAGSSASVKSRKKTTDQAEAVGRSEDGSQKVATVIDLTSTSSDDKWKLGVCMSASAFTNKSPGALKEPLQRGRGKRDASDLEEAGGEPIKPACKRQRNEDTKKYVKRARIEEEPYVENSNQEADKGGGANRPPERKSSFDTDNADGNAQEARTNELSEHNSNSETERGASKASAKKPPELGSNCSGDEAEGSTRQSSERKSKSQGDERESNSQCGEVGAETRDGGTNPVEKLDTSWIQEVDATNGDEGRGSPEASVEDDTTRKESLRLLKKLRNAWKALNINITDRNSPYMEWRLVWTKNGKQKPVKKLKIISRHGSEERICLIAILTGKCTRKDCSGKHKCKGFHGTEVTSEGNTVLVFDIEDIRAVAKAGGFDL